MREIKIKVEDTGRILVGDIWVNVNIEFKPMIDTDDSQDVKVIDAFNNRLDFVASEVTRVVKKIVNDKLSEV